MSDEFGVSKRTIRYDIEILSCSAYIEKGTYTGDFASGVTISWSHGQWAEKFTHKSGSYATLVDGNGFG